jgi:polysaccharide transporter, PST family
MDKVLRKNFSYLFILQNANYIIPLLLLPYLTRVLGAANFGKISFAQAFITYFILFTDFGFNTSATQQVVLSRNNKSALSKVFWSVMTTKIIFASISAIVLLFLVFFVPRLYQISGLLLTAAVGIVSAVLFPLWLFQGLEKMEYVTWLTIFPRLLVLLCTFIYVKLQADYLLALQIQVAGTLLTALAAIIVIGFTKIVVSYHPTFNDIKSSIKEGWHIFISGLATNLYTTTNTVVLGFLTNDAVVGVFTASEKIIRALIAVLSSVSQVTFPRINSYYKESKEKAIVFGSRLLKNVGVITFIGGIFLLFLAPIVVKLLFGLPQFNETISIIRISSFLPFFAICNGIIAINILITFGLKKYLTIVAGIGGVFSILCVFPMAYFFQAK